jgi:hypothetical protein
LAFLSSTSLVSKRRQEEASLDSCSKRDWLGTNPTMPTGNCSLRKLKSTVYLFVAREKHCFFAKKVRLKRQGVDFL